jgi:predicted anti-sigma-YlaC factor YlaD
MDAETMGLAALAAGDAAAFLSGVNPSLFTIRSFRNTWGSADQTASDIHTGVILGNALAFAVGFGATLVSQSWWPLTITLLVAAILDCAYEWALRSPRT